MTQSMTAFARQQAEFDWGTLVWEIRSVNHRYLEASIRMPESLRDAEIPCRDLLRAALKRGKVDAQLKFSPNLGAASIQLNTEQLQQLKTAEQEIATHFPQLSQPSALDILRWPGMIQDAREEDAALIAPALLALFRQCLEALQEQRAKEGEQLKGFIIQRLNSIGRIVAEIKQAMPQILEAQRNKLKDSLYELLENLDETRLEQEIVMLAQKADISEETDRLEAHLLEIRNILEQDDAIGRKLDFLMQELNREANTICSKSVVINTTFNAVELKVLIEQMREQIQNIE